MRIYVVRFMRLYTKNIDDKSLKVVLKMNHTESILFEAQDTNIIMILISPQLNINFVSIAFTWLL